MTHDNNINIGSIGTGNTVNIAQHQAPEAPRIEYAVSQASIEHLSPTEINKGVFAFWGSALLPVLAIVADSLGILSFLGVQTLWVLAVVVPVAFIGGTLNNDKRKIAELSLKPNEARFINGRWVEQEHEGGYLLYRKTARVGRNNQRALRRMPTFGAMRYAYCALRFR